MTILSENISYILKLFKIYNLGIYNFTVINLQKDNMYILDKRLSLIVKDTRIGVVDRARLTIWMKEEITVENKTDKSTRTYDMDKIDDVLCELDDSKIRINALMDYNLKLSRLNDQQINKNMMSHEYSRLSPIMELLNTDIFESLEKAIEILDAQHTEVKKEVKTGHREKIESAE